MPPVSNRANKDFIEIVLGDARSIDESQLPTVADVLRACSLRRKELKTGSQEPKWTEVRNYVAQKVIEIWCKASLPYKSEKRIFSMIDAYHNALTKLRKVPAKHKKSDIHKRNTKSFVEKSKLLFDIGYCKCETQCSCPPNQRVPKEEMRFFRDQKTLRKMFIGGVDKKKKNRRVKMYESSQPTASNPVPIASTSVMDTDTASNHMFSSPSSESDSENEWEPRLPPPKRAKVANKSLEKVAIIADRTGISHRNAALIATAALEDHGIVSKEDTSRVIDKSKVFRARLRTRACLREEASETSQEPIRTLFFDGKKDNSLEHIATAPKNVQKFCKKEHYTLLEEPESRYLGFISPKSGTSLDISTSIIDFLDDKTCELYGVGCDGTNVNVGTKNGIIARLEQHYGTNLHWFVCMLHGNELPLRHLLFAKDGKPKGPSSFPGPIGKLLPTCDKRPVIAFESMPGEEIDSNIEDLSTDQKYLAQIHTAIRQGRLDEALCQKDPGNINLARWITLANRLLRLYVSVEEPSDELICLVQYVMDVYAPSWFQIKKSGE